MISVRNISKNFGPIQAVRNVSFEIQPGEVVGFLGPNGAGKSTTMRIITGFLLPTQGAIEAAGVDVLMDPVEAQKRIGYLPESVALYADMVVVDFLKFIGTFRRLASSQLKQRVRIVHDQCQLEGVLERKIGELSKGYRQRVGLAQALLHDPDVLILDEPTIGLDPNQISEIRTLIRKIGKTKTILLSTHILSEVVTTCSRVIIIHNGQIVAQGSPETLTANTASTAIYHVGLRADVAAVEREIQGLPRVSDFRAEGLSNGILDVRFVSDDEEDLSERIFDLAVQKGWRLSRLVRESQTLEDVFRQLTQ